MDDVESLLNFRCWVGMRVPYFGCKVHEHLVIMANNGRAVLSLSSAYITAVSRRLIAYHSSNQDLPSTWNLAGGLNGIPSEAPISAFVWYSLSLALLVGVPLVALLLKLAARLIRPVHSRKICTPQRLRGNL